MHLSLRNGDPAGNEVFVDETDLLKAKYRSKNNVLRILFH